jgi:hypothetical protein
LRDALGAQHAYAQITAAKRCSPRIYTQPDEAALKRAVDALERP